MCACTPGLTFDHDSSSSESSGFPERSFSANICTAVLVKFASQAARRASLSKLLEIRSSGRQSVRKSLREAWRLANSSSRICWFRFSRSTSCRSRSISRLIAWSACAPSSAARACLFSALSALSALRLTRASSRTCAHSAGCAFFHSTTSALSSARASSTRCAHSAGCAFLHSTISASTRASSLAPASSTSCAHSAGCAFFHSTLSALRFTRASSTRCAHSVGCASSGCDLLS
eukprot:scaffold64733_cov62-Phaeocystis_antarctica.AAC.7